MKKKNSILIMATLLFAACDPGYNFDFAINNQTEHAVTIASLDTAYHHKTVSAPALTDTVVYGKIFDDGRSLKFYALSDTNGGLYSFADTNHTGSRYVYKPRMNTMTFKGHAGYCRYTLNITDDDYNRSE